MSSRFAPTRGSRVRRPPVRVRKMLIVSIDTSKKSGRARSDRTLWRAV